MNRALIVTFALLVAACQSEAPKPAAPPTSAPDELPIEKRISDEAIAAHGFEDLNLLNIGFGAAVVSRTAELTLEQSAIRAIDGDAESMWASPPNDFEQSLLFSLGAPARVSAVGARSPRGPQISSRAMRMELSSDGKTFGAPIDLKFDLKIEPQITSIEPVEARYVRVTTSTGGTRYAAFQSIHVRGAFLTQPVAPASLAGCWTVNGAPAEIIESGGRVSGVIGSDHAVSVDGGVDGAVYRLAWTRGNEWGYAIVTLTPDGNHLSGLMWHEEAAAHSFGMSWFGERRSCTPRPQPSRVPEVFFRRAGWYPLFSLQFNRDDQLVEASSSAGLALLEAMARTKSVSGLRLLSREYPETSAAENERRAGVRLDSLRAVLQRRGVDLSRIELVALGSRSPRRPTATEPMRKLYGVIEIERVEPSR